MTRRVLLRAASGPSIGMGHVMRARSIAQEVASRGGEPLLIVDEGVTARTLVGEGFPVSHEGEAPDWTTRPAAGAWLDGFRDWTPELAALAGAGTRTFLAENRGPCRERCDRLVYPALHYVPDAWDVAHAERVLAGAAWIPLPREVRSMRPSAVRDVDLLVTFGGSDPRRLTERVLSALAGSGLRTVVAVGPHMAERRDAIRSACASGADVRVLRPGTPLPRWFARSRAALTAVGTTLYELAYLGVPALLLANYGSDREALEWYAAHGPHLPLGVAAELSQEGLRAAITTGVRELATRTASPVPELGDGATRLAETLLEAA